MFKFNRQYFIENDDILPLKLMYEYNRREFIVKQIVIGKSGLEIEIIFEIIQN